MTVPRNPLVPALVCILAACASVASEPDDPGTFPLYIGGTVEVSEDSPVRRKGRLESELEAVLRPVPNTTWVGGVRPWLWVHRIVGQPDEPDGTDLRSWVYDRFAEAPVTFDQVSPDRSVRTMETWLFNHGYFDAEIEYTLQERERTTGVRYRVHLEEPYRFSALEWPDGDEPILRAIRETAGQTLIQPGDVYRLDLARRERERIDRALKNEGYYAFSPDYLFFDARRDTRERTVTMRVSLAEETPRDAMVDYRIGTITVFADYSPGGESDGDRIEIGPDFWYVESTPRFKPEVITEAILFAPGDQYRREQHVATINRLISLGVFQFVNIRYDHDPDAATLNARVLLTPRPSRTIEGEVRAVTRSDGFAGPGISARYQDRNAFRGAEELTLDLNAGFETLIGTEMFSVDSYEVGFDATLAIPRIPALLRGWVERRGHVMPRTTIRGGANSLTRFDTYSLDQISGALGYEWRQRPTVSHDVRPIDVSLVGPRDFSSDFEELLALNPALQRSFDEQFIVGSSYRVSYDQRRRRERTSGEPALVLFGQVDSAGNLLSLVQSWTIAGGGDSGDGGKILNTRFSRFVRMDLEGRFYLPLGDDHRVVARASGGVGVPLGASRTLPRVKQFSVGGTNSMRAFRARTIGPGTTPPEGAGGPPVERAADVRLEANLEYRFGVMGILKGAAFMDAGNIWDLESEPIRPFAESAVGVGLGARLDPGFLVVRLDAAAPIRKPWLPRGERWVLDEFDLPDQRWRRDNLVFNLAIGYPF